MSFFIKGGVFLGPAFFCFDLALTDEARGGYMGVLCKGSAYFLREVF